MIDIIILAAGKGTRMKTDKPKALVELAGKPLLEYVLKIVEEFSPRPHVVIGHKGEDVLRLFAGRIVPIWQLEQKGTGHAVMSARDSLQESGARHILVLFADQPMIKTESIKALIAAREKSGASFSMATVSPEHHDGDYGVFKSMGRIVRDAEGSISSIVEYKNASDDVRAIKEVNISAYCFEPKWLWENLPKVKKNPVSDEYYITDLVALAKEKGDKVVPVILPTVEGIGANTPEELLMVERLMRSELY